MAQNRVAVISGGSRGIGLQLARTLLDDGYRVAITGARDVDGLRGTTADLGAAFGGDRVMGIVADAGVPDDAAKVAREVLKAFTRADILINNAGRGPREISETFPTDPPKFWEIGDGVWAEIIASNVNGPFLLSKAFAPHLIANGWGRIINISTSRVTMVRRGFAPYGPSKAALDAMTRIFAQELAGTGVTVNTLLPGGATDTSFIPGHGAGRRGADGNLLPADIMNDALRWLVSEASDGITAARFVGSRWVGEDDPGAAREDTGEPPLIL